MSSPDLVSADPAAAETASRELEAAKYLQQAEIAFADGELDIAKANWEYLLYYFGDLFESAGQRKQDIEYNLLLCYIFSSDAIDEKAFGLIKQFTEDEFVRGAGNNPDLVADLREIFRSMTGSAADLH